MKMPKSRKVLSANQILLIIGLQRRTDQAFSHYYYEDTDGIFTILIENIEVSDDLVQISDHRLPSWKILFRNCTLKNIDIDRSKIQMLEFEGCSINRLAFISSHVSSVNIDESSSIFECLVTSSKLWNQTTNDRYVNLKIKPDIDFCRVDAQEGKAELYLDGHIKKLAISGSSLCKVYPSGTIDSCELNETGYPFDMPVKIKSLSIRDCDLLFSISGIFHDMSISGGNLLSLVMDKVICFSWVSIRNLSTSAKTDGIYFRNGYFGGKVLIKQVDALIRLKLLGNMSSMFINKLILSECTCSLDFVQNPEAESFCINNLSMRYVVIKSSNIFNLAQLTCATISFINFKNFAISTIDNLTARAFYISGLNFDALSERNQDENLLIIRMHIKMHQVPYKVVLSNSDLGKINFINTDLSQFELDFSSSKIIEIFLAGSKMPTKIISKLVNGSNDLNQLHSANTQLKKVHEQHGDFVQSNQYFASEMNAYYDSLPWVKGNLSEKINLLLNRVSSNHGQSWKRGLISTLLVSSLFYFCFCYSIGIRPVIPYDFSAIHGFISVLSYYFEFINPVHKIESLKDLNSSNEIGPWSRIIDGVSRIFIAYFIFQLIAAFRKHGKAK